MADDTTLNPGTGGDVVRNIDKSGKKTQVVALDLGGAGAESLLTGTLPVSLASAPVTEVTGTFFQSTQPISAAALPLPTDAASETTLAALNAKVTAVNTGAVVVTSAPTTAVTGPLTDAQLRAATVPISGSVTANAGTNLNTSALATEAGNLATLTAKDFATQTTLASIKAKTDNLDVTLSGGGAHVIVDSMPTAASAATATEDAPEYTEDQTAALSQDLSGNLRTLVSGLVNESPQAYLDGEVKPLSLNSEGRLRVSVVPADTYIEFFVPFDFGAPQDIYELSTSPWRALS